MPLLSMRTPKSSKYWYFLLLIAPFINILNLRINESAGILAIILPLALFVFTGKKRNRFSFREKSVCRLTFYSMIIIFFGLSFSLIYSIDNLYYYRFFCLSFILMPIFLFWGDSERFINDKLLIILKYYIIVISTSIILGAILIASGLNHLEPMYNPLLTEYMNRPFGIFGQPSVNSCLLCFFYLFYRSVEKHKLKPA